jgi:hypothetical protein
VPTTAPTFDELVREHLDGLFRRDPLTATATGVHDHDGAWPDVSDAGRQADIDWVDRWAARFAALDGAALDAEERIDRDRMLAVLASRRHELAASRDGTWDPLYWIYLLGDGLFGLLAREFAPAPARLASAASRMEGIPAIIDVACSSLGSIPELPISRFHTERALLDLPGIPSLIDEALEIATTVADEPGMADLRPRLDAAATAAKAALERYDAHLRDVVLPASEGEGRLGRPRFAAKLPHTLGDPGMTIEHVLGAAERQFHSVRAEMARLATELWPAWCGDEPRPPGDGELVRAVLDRIATDHPVPDELLDTSRAALKRIEAFCRERDLIGLADDPLDIRWTPLFLQGWAQAMLFSPGPFDVGEKAFFCITPPPPSWPPERTESWLREMNRRMLEIVTIHEAVPGHYLQGVYSNRAPSLVRRVFSDATFREGWAVYVTQVMIDAGFAADDPALELMHWKYYLRAATNAIIDVRIHALGMTEDEALDLMIRGGFQEEAEARAKYDRARLSSTQLSQYFVGSLGLWELEHEVRRRAAAAAIDDPAAAEAVPMPANVGGYPPTPGFIYRSHLERVIGFGDLSLPLLRRVVLGDIDETASLAVEVRG